MDPRAELDHDAWNAWHPAELSHRLGGISSPWCIVGGWALDLWHGHQTREHDDLEFAILRSDFSVFRRALKGVSFHTASDGVVEYLPPDRNPTPEKWQVWCRDMVENCWRADMMLEPGTPKEWVYRRAPGIVRSRVEMVDLTSDGIPYLKPAAVLLFKAKHRRAKDEIDFGNALPKLAASERAWLAMCLHVVHPDHEWTTRLR